MSPNCIFLRHFPTDTAGMCFGQLDVDAPFEQEDLEQIEKEMPHAIDHIWSSPAYRCLSLARALAHKWQVPLSIAEELKEIHFGNWEGKSWQEIPRSSIDQWAEEIWTFRPPGGESPRDVCQRVQAFKQKHPLTDRCLIVSHAGVKRVWNLDPIANDADPAILLQKIPHGKPLLCKD